MEFSKPLRSKIIIEFETAQKDNNGTQLKLNIKNEVVLGDLPFIPEVLSRTLEEIGKSIEQQVKEKLNAIGIKTDAACESNPDLN